MPVRVASLPMYDLPRIRAATDAWWRGIAGHLRRLGMAAVPDRLTRNTDASASWRDPGLLFSQTCGYPLTHALAGRVQVVATPIYGAPGMEGPRYASALVTGDRRKATSLREFRGGVCAINSADSHSGCHVLRHMLAPIAAGRPFFARVIETGSHLRSLRAVAEGKADLCAVDCVTHALLARHVPNALEGTHVFDFSPTAPGLPYITAARTSARDLDCLREALSQAIADPALAAVRATLLIAGIAVLPANAYDEIREMAAASSAAGYPALA